MNEACIQPRQQATSAVALFRFACRAMLLPAALQSLAKANMSTRVCWLVADLLAAQREGKGREGKKP